VEGAIRSMTQTSHQTAVAEAQEQLREKTDMISALQDEVETIKNDKSTEMMESLRRDLRVKGIVSSNSSSDLCRGHDSQFGGKVE
jgi:hypothetical protein